MWEEASKTESDIPLNSHFFPQGSLLSPHWPQGISFICVRFARYAECFASDETYEWDQCFHIMSLSCLSVWWLMTPIPVKVSPQGLTDPLTHKHVFKRANTDSSQDLRVKCLHSDLLGSVLFNSCEYLSLQVKRPVSRGRGKYYFGNQGLVTTRCKNRSTRACGFVQGQ